MGFLDRMRTSQARRPAADVAEEPVTDGSSNHRTGAELLAAAVHADYLAEQDFDRSPDTKARIEHAYLMAVNALIAERGPAVSSAWLGLANVRRYQKGRREDTLAAFDAALAAAPGDVEAWTAYLDYVTYAISAPALIAIVERMPPAVRVQQLPTVLAVSGGWDRWGTMPPPERTRFTAALPGILEALDDQASLGALLSEQGLVEYRTGPHTAARDLMRRAVATGHASPACVDRLTIDLVKLGEKTEAAAVLSDALTRPISSDSLRNRMTKRLARCTAGTAPTPISAPAPSSPAAHTADVSEERADDVSAADTDADRSSVRHLRPGENVKLNTVRWRAQAGWHDPSNTIDVDVCALLLQENGHVGADTDMVFYNQLTSPDGSVRHGGEQTLGSADLFEELHLDLPAVPADVARIAVCASVHTGTFADVSGLHVRLEGDTRLVFAVPQLSTERAVVLFEVYRRDHGWKARAMGQGYADGLAGLARDFGVDIT